MLPKLKHFVPHIVAVVVLCLAVAGATIASSAATNGANTYSEVSNDDFLIRATNFDGYMDIDFVNQIDDGNGNCYSTICSSTEIYLNIYVETKTPLQGNYLNGQISFKWLPTVSITQPTGFTLPQSRYDVALVNSSDNNVSVGMKTAYKTSGYTFQVYFSDFYSVAGNDVINIVLSIRVYGICQYAGSTLTRPTSLGLNISSALSNLSESVTASESSFTELGIKNAIDNSDFADDVMNQLISVNNHLVYTDGVSVYDVADLLWNDWQTDVGILGGVNTTNTRLQNIYQAISNWQVQWSNYIRDTIVNDTSGVADTASQTVDDTVNLESSAQTSATNIITGIASDSDFNTAISSISDIDVNGLLLSESGAFVFWRQVQQYILDYNNLGILATVLTLIVVMSLVAWVLAL